MKEAFFLLGIGGMGMSALANLLADRGDPVEGADREYFRGRSLRLVRRGVRVHPQGSGGLSDFVKRNPGARVRVVASPAVEADTPEMVEARSLELPVESRVDLLAALFAAARVRVAVAGSAGKTTTAALLLHILRASGKDPSWALGGYAGETPNGGSGRSGIFLIEADESDGKLDRYACDLALVTNLFAEHRPIETLRDDFAHFFARVGDDGQILFAEMDPVLGLMTKRRLTGIDGAVTLQSAEGDRLEIRLGRKLFRVPLPGIHNFRNVQLAVAGARELGVPIDDALRALEGFPGVENRMSVAGEACGVRVFCDFAHAPREIEASYAAARSLGRRVVYAWQPHGYAPTALQRDELLRVFAGMHPEDTLLLTDIYYGGGTVERKITGRELFEAACGVHGNTHFVADLALLPETVAMAASSGDVAVLSGARDIFDHAGRVVAALAGACPWPASGGTPSPWLV